MMGQSARKHYKGPKQHSYFFPLHLQWGNVFEIANVLAGWKKVPPPSPPSLSGAVFSAQKTRKPAGY